MKHNLLFIIALFFCAFSFGQGELDAYRFSNNDLSGTARGQAMGGAFGALGGDVTGVAINPAGLGVYRSSEVVANVSLASSLTGGNSFRESTNKFSFDNLSYISYYPLIKGSMLSLNFGFNYNRIKDFNRTYNTSRSNMKSSLTDYMLAITDGVYRTDFDKDPYDNTNLSWLSILAWDGYLIDPKENGAIDEYQSILDTDEQVSPYLRVSEKGKIESYDFSVGSSIADRFYWGVTVAITDISYVMTSDYEENFLGSKGGGFQLDNYLETQGSGFQFKTGIIFKPVDALRIGLAYHSPTWYTMTDYYNATAVPNGIYDDKGNLAKKVSTPEQAYANYYLRTPGAVTLSFAGVLGTKAIISMDYELKNYASMNLKDNDAYNIFDENEKIKNNYKNASTIRTGLEYRFTPQFSGRLGYAYMQNPFDKSITEIGKKLEGVGTVPHYTLSNSTSYYTGGFGYRFTPQFYIDFAMTLRVQNDDLYFFQPIMFAGAEVDSYQGEYTNKTLKGLLTFGYKF